MFYFILIWSLGMCRSAQVEGKERATTISLSITAAESMSGQLELVLGVSRRCGYWQRKPIHILLNDQPEWQGTACEWHDISATLSGSCNTLTCGDRICQEKQVSLSQACSGDPCELRIQLYDGRLCLADNNCVELNDTIECACTPGFIGPDCNIVRTCIPPSLTIEGGGQGWNQTTSFPLGQTVHLTGRVSSSQCASTQKASFQWSVFAMPADGTELGEGTRVDMDYNDPAWTTADLVIAGYALREGLYRVQLEVCVSLEDIPVNITSTAWIQMVASPLRAIILGGSLVSVGLSDDIELDAGSSDDPNERSALATSGLNFTWFCVRPQDAGPTPTTWRTLTNTNGTGCLGAGVRLPDTASTLAIPASRLLLQTLPADVVFTVYVSKAGRRATSTSQTVTVVPGNPPIMRVRCLRNCALYLNPSESLVLTAECGNCDVREKLGYEWSMTSGLLGLLFDWEDDTTTGRSKKNLVVAAYVFDDSLHATFDISVTVTRRDGTTTTATYTLHTNAPPSGGSCDVTPLEGVVLETVFFVSCLDYEDADLPLSYEVYVVTEGNSEGTMLFQSFQASFNLSYVPSGKKEAGFIVGLRFVVRDAYGAGRGETKRIMVKEKTMSLDELRDITTGPDSMLTHLLNTGDTQATNLLINTVCSVLNAQRVEDDGDGKAQFSEEEKHQAKQERTQMRDHMVETLANVEVQSLETLQQTTFALIEVTSVHDEVSVQAQVNATEVLKVMSTFLLENTHIMKTAQKVTESGRLLLGGVSNILGASLTSEQRAGPGNVTTGDTPLTAEDIQTAKEKSRDVNRGSLDALNSVVQALLGTKVVGESPTVVETDLMIVQLNRAYPSDLLGVSARVQTRNGSTFVPCAVTLPQSFKLLVGGAQALGTEIVQFLKNPYTWSNTSSSITSNVMRMDLYGDSGPLTVEDLADPINVYVPHGGSGAPGLPATSSGSLLPGERLWLPVEVTEHVVVIIEVVNDTDTGGTRTDDAAKEPVPMVTVQVLRAPEFVAAHGPGPVDNFSLDDGVFVVNVNGTERNYTTNVTEIFQVPVRNLSSPWSLPLKAGFHIVEMRVTNASVPVNLTLVTAETTCRYWEEGHETWSTRGCQVGPETSMTYLHCQCTHLTAFAGGFLVMPNMLNLSEDIAKFATFWENPVGIIVVLVVLVVYICLVVWARRRDREYALKALPVDLMDNNTRDAFVYMLTVVTGDRRGAGTTSQVTVQIEGELDTSVPHLLSCSGFAVLQRGDINYFLLRAPRPLGAIKAVRFWHHNAGSSPSWFVCRAIVTDARTGDASYVICNTWLAVDLGDCVLDKTFHVATEHQIRSFQNLFMSRAEVGFRDKHLWFCALRRPAHSTFTCVQRVSCCLTLFMTYMLTNIMFYGIKPEPGEQNMDLGPFTITWTEIRIGLQTAILTLPISLLIVVLFRNSRSRHPVIKPWRHNLLDTVPDYGDVAREASLGAVPGDGGAAREASLGVVPGDGGAAGEASLGAEPGDGGAARDASLEGVVLDIPKDGQCARPWDQGVTQALAKRPSIAEARKQFLAALYVHQQAAKPSGQERSEPIRRTSIVQEKPQELLASVREIENLDSVDRRKNIEKSNDMAAGLGHSRAPRLSLVETRKLELLQCVASQRQKERKGLDEQEMTRMDKNVNANVNTNANSNDGDETVPDTNSETKTTETLGESGNSKSKKKSGECWLPWWMVYVGWLLVVLVTAVCSFFTILYTFNYGLSLSLQWVKSLLFSWVTDILLQQPLSVLGTAVLISLILKTPEDLDHVDPDALQTQSEETEEAVDIRVLLAALRRDPRYEPPKQRLIQDSQQRRHLEGRINAVAVEIVRYALFLYLILLLAYAQRDTNVYWQNKSIADVIFNRASFQQISCWPSFWAWAEDVRDDLYDDQIPGLLSNQVSLKLEPPRLRQQRVIEEKGCIMERIQVPIPCTWSLSRDTEDRGNYNGTWGVGAGNDSDVTAHPAWRYRHADHVGSPRRHGKLSSYNGGGYVASLGATRGEAAATLRALRGGDWVDGGTVAVVFELTLYTVNVNLLTLVSVVVERLPSAGVHVTRRLDTLRLYRSAHGLHVFILVFEVVYCLYTLYFIVYEACRVRRLRLGYVRQPWNLLEVLAIAASLTVIGLYAAHAVEVQQAVAALRAGRPTGNRFQTVLTLDQAMTLTLGLLVTLGMVKFLHLLRFNPLIYRLGCVLARTGTPIAGYSLILAVLFVSFGGFMQAVVGHRAEAFRTLPVAITTLFQALLGTFTTDELEEVLPFWGPLVFILFVFAMMAVFFNMFVTTIMTALARISATPPPASDAQLLWLLVYKVKEWLGIKTRRADVYLQ